MFTSVAVSNNLRYNIYRCPTTIYSSTATSKEGASGDEDKRNYIRPYLKQLFLLCRPINFPIVLLFHVLGVHQAVEFWKITFQPTSSSPMLSSVLKEPSMIMVLLSLMLVTATSMITNDYYDARNGVDVVAEIDENKHVSDKYGHYHPLVKGKVPFTVAKTFDSVSICCLLMFTEIKAVLTFSTVSLCDLATVFGICSWNYFTSDGHWWSYYNIPLYSTFEAENMD